MIKPSLIGAVALAAASALSLAALPAAAETTRPAITPGVGSFDLGVGDDYAGGERTITFTRAYAGETPEGTSVYIYAPQGWENGAAGVFGLDPTIDPDPGDNAVPCATNSGIVDLNSFTPETINALGDEVANHIVAVDETHFGPIGDHLSDGTPVDPSLVLLVYNVFDESYYNCDAGQRTAGYFAPNLLADHGINSIVLDSLDFEDMTGSPDTSTDLTYEGVVAHELEHLLHNYSDTGEVSWVDEGLADFAMFLNGYPVGGSHITYQQVFHRETSLTRWGGGLENYGASYTFVQYLWDRAGGNGSDAGAAQHQPDSTYSGVAGDLLIKTIFDEPADSIQGVQNAIDSFNAAVAGGTSGTALPDFDTLFQDWALAVDLDDESSDLYDISSVDMGSTADSSGWSIDMANQEYWDDRGIYQGALPASKLAKLNVPAGTALPFGVSYEYYRNVAPRFRFTLDAEATVGVPDHDGDDLHWYGGSSSQTEAILDVDTTGDLSGATLDFATWYFIEEGWDYGFVEALVDGQWQTVPVTSGGSVISTNSNPQGNNTEGNGLTGTSGGEYFVDDPTYLEASATLPAGTTDVRFRYSTDAAYVDTGWFIDAATLDGTPVSLGSPDGTWTHTDGRQHNNFALQVVSSGDLTPGVDSPTESTDSTGRHVYRYTGAEITTDDFRKASGKDVVRVVISNMPSGVINSLDADYTTAAVKIKG